MGFGGDILAECSVEHHPLGSQIDSQTVTTQNFMKKVYHQ